MVEYLTNLLIIRIKCLFLEFYKSIQFKYTISKKFVEENENENKEGDWIEKNKKMDE